MIELKPDVKVKGDNLSYPLPLAFHPSFYSVYEKLKKWLNRYSQFVDNPLSLMFSNSQHALFAQDLHLIKQTPCGAVKIARTYFQKRRLK